MDRTPPRLGPTCLPRGRTAASVRGALLASSGLVSVLWGVPAMAGPADPTVAAGGVVIGGSGAHTRITQSSQRAIIDWRSFSLDAGERVSVTQPGSGSVLLNRVRGTDPSVINGSIDANGQVMLVNPNGVMIGAGGRIDAGGFLATTSDITDADFMAGRYVFGKASGLHGAAIVNDGVIRVAQGGYAALSAAMVSNRGLVEARLGSIVLGGAETFTLDLIGDGLLRYEITQGSQGASDGGALVRNAGRLIAQGGQVLMTARAVKDVLGHVINTSGIVEATGVQEKNGRIVIVAEEGDVGVSGRLDASSATGTGGAVDVTGRDVTLSAAAVDVSGGAGGGQVRLGGGYQGRGDLANARNLTIDAASTVRADATAAGDGGRIIAWSDGTTRADGALSVRGGAEGGDGGFVETSGKGLLAVSGQIDLTSAFGTAGEWLLDPTEITIQDGTDTGTYSGSVVTVGTLEGIAAGTVTLVATEKITVADLGGDQTINLRSGVSIDLQVSGDGAIVFADANDGITAAGAGTIALRGSTSLGAGYLGNSNGSQPIGRITTAGGAITLESADGITLAGAISSNGGAVTIDGNTDNGPAGGLTINVPISTGGGNLILKSANGGITINSNVDVGAGTIGFTSSGTTTLAGTITASGNVDLADPLTISSSAAVVTNGTITVSGNLTMQSGSSLRLRGTAVDLTGASYTSKSNGSITLEPYTASQSIAVNGTGSSFNVPAGVMTDLQGFSSVTIGRSDGTGALTISNAITSYNGNLILRAGGTGGSITQGAAVTVDSGKSVTYSAGGNVTLTAALTAPAGISIAAGGTLSASDALTTSGNASLSSTGAMTLAATLTGTTGISLSSGGALSATSLLSSSGSAVVSAAGDVSIGTSLNASSGSTVSSGEDLVLAGTITMASGSNLVLAGSSFDLSGVTAFSGVSSSSSVTLQPSSVAGNVIVNDTDGTGGALDITSALLGKVTDTGIGANFGTVIIGRADGTGQVSLPNDLTLDRSLTLRAGGSGGGIVQTGNVTLTGTGALSYLAPVTLSKAGTVALTTAGGAITFGSTVDSYSTGAVPLTLSAGTGAITFTGSAGVARALGAVTFSSAGSVTITNALYTTASLDLSGRPLTLGSSAAIESAGTLTLPAAVTLAGGGAIRLRATILDLGATTFSTGGSFGDITLEPASASTDILINGAGETGSFDVTSTILSKLGNFGILTLGRTDGTGQISFAAATDRSATSNALVLRAGGAGGSISQGYAVTLGTGKSATYSAASNISLTSALTAPGGISISAGGSLSSTAALTASGGAASLTSTGAMTLSGGISAVGASISGSDAVTLSGTLDAGSGNASVTAGQALGISAAVTTTGSATLSLVAGTDLDLSATATAGGSATLSAGRDLDLTGAALTAPSGLSLTAGRTLTGDRALTAASGAVQVRSTGATTLSGAVTATGIDFSSADALTLSGALSATSGNLLLSAGTDLSLSAAASASGSATLSAGQDLALTAQLTAPSGATLRAGRSLSVTGASAGVTTTNAAIVLNADRDASGGGDLLLGAGATLVSNGGDITLGGGPTPASGVAQGLASGGVAGGRGIQVTGSATRIDARGTAGGGAILLRGTAAAGVASAVGVEISAGATLQTSHSGTLTLAGTGASGTTLSAGVSMGGGATLATASGAIAITGTASGTGSNPYGVLFDHDPSGRTRVYSTGGGAIAIAASGSDAALAGASGSGNSQAQIGTDGTSTYASAITLTADRMAIGALAFQTSGAATLRTGTAARAVDLGSATDSASGTLELSAAELGAVSAASLTIGRNDTGVATGQMRLTGAVSAVTGGTLTLVADGIVQSAGTLTTGTLAAVSSGAITLAQGNSFSTLASASASGAIDIRRAGGALAVTGAVAAGANGVTIAATGGNLTLGASSSVTTTGATDIVLSTDGNFTFTTGASLSAGRKYLIYSTNPDDDVRGSLTAGQYLWNRTLSTQAPGDLTDSTSRFIYSYQPTVTVTAADKTKVYGDSDPALTFTATGFRFDDTAAVLTGALGRDSGEGAGSHTIRQGTLESPTGYAIAFNTGTLAVTPATLTVTPDNLTKVYGDDDPTLTYSLTGLKLSDTASVMSGTAGRVTGENVGTYTLGLGTLSGGSNYSLVLASTPKTLTVTPAPLTITPTALDKPYGGTDPTFTYTATGLKRTDTTALMTGALTRAAGETLGSYALGLGTLSAGGNYTITLSPQNFTIRRDRLTVTAQSQAKTYGDADPGLSWSVVGEVSSDGAHLLTGSLSRAAGETVGSYGIGIGTLAADSNYEVIYVGASITITQATLTVTPAAQTKVYGDADPTLGYSVSGLKNGDGTAIVRGALARASGNNVGSYGISLGTLSAGGNYKIEMAGSASLTITPAPLSVSAPLLSRIYGDADPTLALTVTGLRNGDSQGAVLSGSVLRAAGEAVGSYDITQGGLTANANYTLSFTPGKLTITPAALTVSAQAGSKVYGDADPTLGITVSGLKNGDTEATALSGSVSRAAGTGVGSYAIGQGSLAASANYMMTFTGSTFTIAPRQLLITANSVQRPQRQENPALTVTYSGFASGDGEAVVSGLTVSTGADANSAPGDYAIELSGGSAANYTVTMVNGVLTVIPANSPALPRDVAENAPITAITNIPQAPVPPVAPAPVATGGTGGGASGGEGGGAGPGGSAGGAAGGGGAAAGGATAGVLGASSASPSGTAPGAPGGAGTMPQSVSLSVADQVVAAASGLAGDDGSSTSEVIPGLLNQQQRIPTAVPEGVPGIEQNFPSLGKGY